jgi:hypothetical protein
MATGEPKERTRKAAAGGDVAYPTVPEDWYRERDREVALEAGLLHFDLDVSQGQVRPLNKKAVEERLKEFRAALPVVPIRVTLWPMDLHGMNF